MAANSAEERPGTVSESSRGTERDERVHVGAADLDLSPGTAVKLCAGVDLDNPGEHEGNPLKPAVPFDMGNPFCCHQNRRYDEANPQGIVPASMVRLS